MYYRYALSAPMRSPFSAREWLTRDFSPPRVIIIILLLLLLFSKPAISLSEQVQALNFSPDVSKVCGGVHGHQAIVLLFLHVGKMDRGWMESVQQRHFFKSAHAPLRIWAYARLTCALFWRDD